jgi:hypothetical protein
MKFTDSVVKWDFSDPLKKFDYVTLGLEPIFKIGILIPTF